MEKKRILFFVSSMGVGGAERVIQLLLNYYCESYECDLIVVSGNSCAFELNSRIHVIYLDEYGKNKTVGNKILTIIQKRKTVNRYIHQLEEDGWTFSLIAAHLNMAHIMALVSSKRKETLYIMHNRQRLHNAGADTFLYKYVFRLIFKACKLGSVSEGIKRELIDKYGIPGKQIEVICNPVDINKIRSLKAKDFRKRRKYILGVGRLTPEKNFRRLIEIYNKGNFFKKYDLVILGDGELRDELYKQISDLKLQKYVKLKGYCKNPYVWMEHAEILVNTSDYEALPMTLIEALAVGTKVVSAQCNFGPDEVLVGELSKYLVSPINDINKYIEKINKALVSYPEIKREYYERFSVERIAEVYFEKDRQLSRSCYEDNCSHIS